MAFTQLLEQAGGAGLFQALQVATLLLPNILLSSHMLGDNFLAATPGHRCWAPVPDNGSGVLTNLTREALLLIAIPPGPDRRPHPCRRFRRPQWQLLDPNATATNWSEAATEPCVDGWVYDHSTFTSTVVEEWGLVCDHRSLKPVAQAVFMTGILLGSFAWGLLSCWFGRKAMLGWCCLQVALSGTATIFAPSFLTYCGLRFLSAFALAGIILTSTILMVEWTTTERRAVTMAILGGTYAVGQIVLGGLAFLLRDWRTLHLAMSVPFFAIFLTCWWLPESAQWLIITGKPDRALQELHKVARINGHKEAKKTLTIEVLLPSMEKEMASAKAQPSLLKLVRMPVLCWRICCISMVSFSVMFSYYGLVLDLQNLGGDIFLLQVLFGTVDLLGRASSYFVLKSFRRRTVQAGFQVLASLAILVNMLVPHDLQALRSAFAVLGKGCFAVCLTSYMVLKAELFPTSLRMTIDGFQQSVGRIGAIVGPLMKMTQQTLPQLPLLSYCVILIISSLLVLLFLPETKGLPLPDTIQDLEKQRSAAAAARGSRREAVVTESTWF